MQKPEPPIITIAKEARYGNKDRTVFVPAGSYAVWKQLGVRPKVVSEREHGRLYSLSPPQARKILTKWETSLEKAWRAYLEPPQ